MQLDVREVIKTIRRQQEYLANVALDITMQETTSAEAADTLILVGVQLTTLGQKLKDAEQC